MTCMAFTTFHDFSSFRVKIYQYSYPGKQEKWHFLATFGYTPVWAYNIGVPSEKTKFSRFVFTIRSVFPISRVSGTDFVHNMALPKVGPHCGQIGPTQTRKSVPHMALQNRYVRHFIKLRNPDSETREIMKSHESHACHKSKAGIDFNLKNVANVVRRRKTSRPGRKRLAIILYRKKHRGCVLVP